MINLREIMNFLSEAAEQYAKSAPVVTTWIEDCYDRLSSDLTKVSIFEIIQLLALKENETWEHPNYAANRAYKAADRLERDTTGMIGF